MEKVNREFVKHRCNEVQAESVEKLKKDVRDLLDRRRENWFNKAFRQNVDDQQLLDESDYLHLVNEQFEFELKVLDLQFKCDMEDDAFVELNEEEVKLLNL